MIIQRIGCAARIGAFAALIAACMLGGPAQAQPPGSLYVFGDSLSDNGNIPRLTGIPYPPPPYVGHRFSNGPVWAEYLPGLTGLNFKTSNDYAVGGAFAGPLVVGNATYDNLVNLEDPFFPHLPNELQEIQSFRAAGGHFGPSDVVGIWVGGNNYFATERLVGADPAQAQHIVTQNVNTVIAQTGQAIRQVAALGARQIVLQNLVPFGKVPTVNGTPQLVALGDQIIALHNAGLSKLAANLHDTLGVNILLINQQQIFAEISADPGAYGFTNVTDACFASTSSACAYAPASVQNKYLWWNVHPTTHGHRVIAEYIASALNGFDSLAVPAQLLDAGAQAFSNVVAGRMAALRTGAGGASVTLPMLADAASGDTGPLLAPGHFNGRRLSVWLSGGYDFGSRDNAPGNLGFSDQIGMVAGGADYRVSPHLTAGVAFGYGTLNATVNQGATMHANAYDFAAYAVARLHRLFVDGQVDIGIDRFAQISRPGVLAPITASPDGHTVTAALEAGYMMHVHVKRLGAVTIGPVLGFNATTASIGAYAEQGNPALTLSVASQSYTRDLLSAGLAAHASRMIDGVTIRPHGAIGLQAQLNSSPGHFASVFTDEPLVGLTTVYPTEAREWGVADVGLTATMAPRLDATVDFASTFARNGGVQRMVSAGMRYRF